MKPILIGSAGGNITADRYIVPRGFAAGSIVLTLDGEIPVEHLTVGDRVITRDSGMAVISDIHATKVTCEMVAVMAGSLGHTRPDRDSVFPADQPILLRDWRAQAMYGRPQALSTMRELVDGEFVRLCPPQELILWQIGFENSHIVYVDGLEIACDPILVTQDKAA